MKAPKSYDAIFITEKPEIGTAIIKSLGGGFTQVRKHVREGMVNRKRTLIIDFEGNPFRLQHPNEINPALNNWANVEACLPIPQMPKPIPVDGQKKHLDFTKKSCEKSHAVFIATDSDVEGEAIGQDIAAYCGVGATAQRVLFNESLSERDVINAIRNRQPLPNTRPKWRAAQAKRYSDWYWQYLVRAHTANARLGLMGAQLHLKDPKQVISSGRVQSIVQLLIASHHRMRENYKPVRYHRITADSQFGTFEMLPPPPAIGDDRIKLNRQGIRLVISQQDSLRVYNDVKAYDSAVVESVMDTIDTIYPPNPFDATSLQSEAFRQFKMSPKWTMKVADKLRMSGYVTYVRTDDSRLPESMLRDGLIEPKLQSAKLIGGLPSALTVIRSNLLSKSPSYHPKCFVQTVSGHHGVIPSDKVPDFTSLDRVELLIYELIVRQFVTALMPPAIIKRRKIIASIPVPDVLGNPKTIFTLTDHLALDVGWKILSTEPPNSSWSVESVREGMHIPLEGFNHASKESTAPPPMKIPDLLRQLKRPSLICPDQRTLSIIENARGIGTAATRDSIIEKVKYRNYCTEDDEGRLLPTLFGSAYVDCLHPDLLDVAITADIEQNMLYIEQAASDEEAIALRNRVLMDSHAFITKHVQLALQKHRSINEAK